MNHVTDELELYALGALPEADRARVAAHLAQCPACREQSRVLEEVAIALPETLTPRDVPARVRSRILATARGAGAVRTTRGSAWTSWLRPSRVALAGLTLAVVVLSSADIALTQQRDAAVAKRDAYATDINRVAHGGKDWYMAGLDQWRGSGGTLFAPSQADSSPYVVFHDLRPLAPGSVYTLWLVDGDGHWVRAANFTPNGDQTQTVFLDERVDGYTQCTLTLEPSTSGKRTGPVVMQSRIG